VAVSTHKDLAGDGHAAAPPHLELSGTLTSPRAVILVLHGGKAESLAPVEPRHLTVRRMRPVARALETADDGVAVGLLRYRYRGWNDAAADPVADVAYALGEITTRYGPVPIVLVGHSMGGRAALRAAGHPDVRGVVALAPWLPGSEPVDQLTGRDLVVLHGARDLTTSPRASAQYVARATAVTRRAVCLRVPSSGHGMLLRARLWHELTAAFVAAIESGEPFTAAIDRAHLAGCRSCRPEGSV
jgi:dienelactone hydrolase